MIGAPVQMQCRRCGANPGRVRCLADYAKACTSYGAVEPEQVPSSGAYVGISTADLKPSAREVVAASASGGEGKGPAVSSNGGTNARARVARARADRAPASVIESKTERGGDEPA